MFIILTLVVGILFTIYQIYRYKTPFYLIVENNDIDISIYISRRAFREWPRSMLAQNFVEGHSYLRSQDFEQIVFIGQVNDPDIDEKLADGVAKAKTVLATCKHGSPESNALASTTKRMIKA